MHNKKYKETYRELSHGTDVESETMVLKLVNVVIVGVDRGFIFMILRKKHGGLQGENVVK